MAPDSLRNIDPTAVTFLLGMVAKGKDFVMTKGVTIAITVIFFSGGAYYQFNSFVKKQDVVLAKLTDMEREINEMKLVLNTTNGRIDVVSNEVKNVKEKVSEWMRLYGPRRLTP